MLENTGDSTKRQPSSRPSEGFKTRASALRIRFTPRQYSGRARRHSEPKNNKGRCSMNHLCPRRCCVATPSPYHRNRAFNKRQSRDHFDRTTDNGEKDGAFFNSNIVALDRGINNTTNNSNNNTESLISGTVSVNGCNISEAVKLMTDRWAAAMHSHNDQSLHVSERPVVYSSNGGGSVWGSSKLANQPSVMDFLAELGQAIRRANNNQVNGERTSGAK